jgi:hypothetical protein
MNSQISHGVSQNHQNIFPCGKENLIKHITPEYCVAKLLTCVVEAVCFVYNHFCFYHKITECCSCVVTALPYSGRS